MRDQSSLRVKRQILDDLTSVFHPDDTILFAANGLVNGDPTGVAVSRSELAILIHGIFGGVKLYRTKLSDLVDFSVSGKSNCIVRNGNSSVIISDLDCNPQELRWKIKQWMEEDGNEVTWLVA